MNRKSILDTILKERLVVIIRVKDAAEIPAIVECLIKGGVKVLEITANTPGYAAAIRDLRTRYPDLIVGAGSVINVDVLRVAIDAGAQFLVTPNTRADVVLQAHAYDVPVLMGAMTPTEVVQATEFGADVVKLFPAGDLGPTYLKSLAKGPFLDTVFFAVGGVDEHNAKEWLEAGAKGVGVGGSLAATIKDSSDAEKLVSRIKQLVSAL